MKHLRRKAPDTMLLQLICRAPTAQMNRRWRLKISFLHTGQRDSRRLHLRHMQACPQGISATCTSRTMHTLQSRPGTPGGPSPLAYRLRLPVPSCFSGMSTTVSAISPAGGTQSWHAVSREAIVITAG